MIIAISGCVGTGKTSLSNVLAEKLDFEVLHLNEIALKYKIEEVLELQTFDFNLDDAISEIEKIMKEYKGVDSKNLIVESHFSHFINPELVDLLVVINRDLKLLEKEYISRGYNSLKIKENLEAESFNICFYEALEEGYVEEEQVFCFDNSKSVDELIVSMLLLINEVKNGS